MRPPALLPLILAASVASADTPDLSSEMVPLCNPNASRWTASQAFARAATSIGVCDGRLFVSGGDWDDNLGPCPIFVVDPYSGEYVKEYESGTESIDYFRYGSDGCLYAPSVDPREGHANQCDVARRNADGSWTKLNIALRAFAARLQLRYPEPVDFATAAAECGMSRRTFYRKWMNLFDSTPHRYLLQIRLAHAARMLVHEDRTVAEIALACGFSGPARFCADFRSAYGTQPMRYRQEQRAEIRWTKGHPFEPAD